MSQLSFAAFQKNYVPDTKEGIDEIIHGSSGHRFQPIGVGKHEVVISRIYTDKEGNKFKLKERGGGAVETTLIFSNAARHEQMFYFSIPLAITFSQACTDPENKFLFSKAFKLVLAARLDPAILREAVLFTEGRALDNLVGCQLVVENYWPLNTLHMEYDSTAKANFFVNSMGEKFTSGELAGPYSIDTSLPQRDRYKNLMAIAYQHGYKFADSIQTNFLPHPTASNDAIQKSLEKMCNRPIVSAPKSTTSEIKIVNKTIEPVFATNKRPTSVPIDFAEPTWGSSSEETVAGAQ